MGQTPNNRTATEELGNIAMPTSEAARFLGIEPQTLRRWRQDGRGPKYIRIGKPPKGRCYYRLRELIDFLDSQTFASTSEEAANAK